MVTTIPKPQSGSGAVELDVQYTSGVQANSNNRIKAVRVGKAIIVSGRYVSNGANEVRISGLPVSTPTAYGFGYVARNWTTGTLSTAWAYFRSDAQGVEVYSKTAGNEYGFSFSYIAD